MDPLSAKNIISTLEQLLTLHEALVEKSKTKTEVIKVGDVETLKSLTNEERKWIKMVNTAQKDLLNHAKDFLEQRSILMDTPTLQDCLPYVKAQESTTLTTLQTQLVEKVFLLKKQNDLNQQLLKQSLSFVQLSLDLLTPDIDMYNYERPDSNQPFEQHGRSLFDSNA